VAARQEKLCGAPARCHRKQSRGVSAGETFTQALLDRAPTSVRTPPNGWWFGLPNERYLTRTGTTFDGAGIPPQVRVPVFTDSDLAAHRDPAFDRALSLLTQE
jgi:C-terminal processing protease CtpA/Prc